MKKAKIFWLIIVILALVFAGFLWYRSYSAKEKSPETSSVTSSESSVSDTLDGNSGSQEMTSEEADQLEQEEENFNATCENGDWVPVSDQSEGDLSSATGKLRRVYPDDDTSKDFIGYEFFIEGTSKIALAGSNLSKLDYFEDREVEVQGVKDDQKNQITVVQVRCAGAEADKNTLDQRKKMMDYIAANINTIASTKAKYQKWVVDEIDIVNDNNVYVMYYDAVEDDENSEVDEDTGRKALLEISPKSDGGYNVKQLAYFEMGEDDYELKQGADKFADEETMDYSYDPDTGSWERY